MEITQEDRRLLKYFFPYIKSYGDNKAHLNLSIYEDGEIYDNGFYVGETGKIINLPNEFKQFIDKIKNSYEFIEIFDNVDEFNYGEIDIYLDTKENKIYFKGKYSYYDTDCYDITRSIYDTFADSDEQSMLEKFFEKLEKEGHKFGEISFDGGGDNGYIQDELILDGDIHDNAPDKVLDICYDMLQSSFGGWEKNEGSQGNFILDIKNKQITLNICLNVEEMGEVDYFRLPKEINL